MGVASNVLSPPSRPESPPWTCPPCCTVFKHPRTTMSWQSYVDDQLISTNMIKNAVTAGHDGNIWASSSGFNVTAAELKVILDRYSSTDQLAMNGVTVGGTKYMFLSANDRVVRARKGQSGVHCTKTVQALIVCVRGASGARAGGHGDGEARRVPHLRRLLTAATSSTGTTTTSSTNCV